MIYSLCIVSSFSFPQKVFYLKYRDILIKYITNPNPRWGDMVIFETPPNLSKQEGFYQAMDYFAALMYFQAKSSASIKIYYPIQSPRQGSIVTSTHNGIIEPMSVLKNVGIQFPEFVIATDTPLQRQLLRLWLSAHATENIYYQNLFYWQILVFPDKRDQVAKQFIDEHVASLDTGHINEKWLKLKEIMSNNPKKQSLGEFVQDKIKNTISHFVRENGYTLDVVNLDTMRLFSLSRDLLHYFCLLKLKQIIPDIIANRNTCQILTASQIAQFEKNILSFRNKP